MATLDHIGLNRYIYMSASAEDMTLGSHTISDISNSSGNSILGGNLDDSRILLGINLYNNGPYGYSSWQQMRMSHNPLSRHLRKNNQYAIVENGKQRIYFKNGKRFIVKDRYGKQHLLDEPAVISNYKPISLIGSLVDYNNTGLDFSIDIAKKISMNNNIAGFTNEKINNISSFIEKPDEAYDILKGYYLEEAINSAESPMSSFEKLIFKQTIYPPQQYTYKSYTRARTTFTFNWNSEIQQRQIINASNNFGTIVPNSSIWPLDVDPNWVNFPLPLINNLGLNFGDTIPDDTFTPFGEDRPQNIYDAVPVTSSFGILLNQYSQVAPSLGLVGLFSQSNSVAGTPWTNNSFIKPAPFYSRRHSMNFSQSVVAPSGRTELIENNNLTFDTLFGGEAAWDVPSQSGKYPFYDSYAEYSDEMRRRGKCKIIIFN